MNAAGECWLELLKSLSELRQQPSELTRGWGATIIGQSVCNLLSEVCHISCWQTVTEATGSTCLELFTLWFLCRENAANFWCRDSEMLRGLSAGYLGVMAAITSQEQVQRRQKTEASVYNPALKRHESLLQFWTHRSTGTWELHKV